MTLTERTSPSVTPYMTPGTFNLAIYQGDTYEWTFRIWQDPAKTMPYDLTGATVESQIRDKPEGAESVTLTCDLTLPNIVTVSLDAASSALVRSGVWDLQVTFDTGWVSTFVRGSVTVTPDVTVTDTTEVTE
jgi:hypothetical protein